MTFQEAIEAVLAGKRVTRKTEIWKDSVMHIRADGLMWTDIDGWSDVQILRVEDLTATDWEEVPITFTNQGD